MIAINQKHWQQCKKNRKHHNQGDGNFVDITGAVGIQPFTNGHGIAWDDYNNDGYLDVYVVRGHQGSEGATNDTLYRRLVSVKPPIRGPRSGGAKGLNSY